MPLAIGESLWADGKNFAKAFQELKVSSYHFYLRKRGYVFALSSLHVITISENTWMHLSYNFGKRQN